MQLFYSNNVHNDKIILDEAESRHCTKVLRKLAGDEIIVTDGKGHFYHATISKTGKIVEAEITSTEKKSRAGKVRIHIALAPTKNMDRMEWMTEKLTEMGVDEISFIVTANSERRVIKLDRLHKKAISAIKQSVQANLPLINELVSLNDFLNQSDSGEKYIAHLSEEAVPLSEAAPANGEVTVLVGPEGDFTKEEIEQCTTNGYRMVSLGNNRLRTETAALVACTILGQTDVS